MFYILLACESQRIGLSEPILPVRHSPAELPSGYADWYVDGAGAGDFSSIQSAIDAAEEGDWILVAPGTYEEAIDFSGKNLWITSRDGAESTILDGGRSAATVTLQHGEAPETGMVGFTIKGGSATTVNVVFASLHLEDVVLTEGEGTYVISGDGADLELNHVEIRGNADRYATVIMDRGALQIENSSIACGKSGYTIYQGHGYMQIDQSDLSCNRGDTVYSEHTTGSIFRSRLKGNIYLENEDDHNTDTIELRNSVLSGNYTAIYGTLTIRNSIVSGATSFTMFPDLPGVPVIENSIFTGSKCAITSDGEMVVRNNDFWNTTPSCGETVWDGNLETDPLLVDYSGGDDHLSAGSPLVDAGVEDSAYNDPDGSRNDIGAFGGPSANDIGWTP